MADVKPEVLYLKLLMEYNRNFNGIRIFFGSKNRVGQILVLSNVRVSEKSTMVACNRKWIWNYVYNALTRVIKNTGKKQDFFYRNTGIIQEFSPNIAEPYSTVSCTVTFPPASADVQSSDQCSQLKVTE